MSTAKVQLKKLKNELKQSLNVLGIKSLTFLQEVKKPVTGETINQLINPQRRVVKTVLALSEPTRTARINEFTAQAQTKIASDAEDNALLENS